MKKKSYSHIGRKKHSVDAAFWEQCYRKGDAFWDHGEASHGLVDFLKQAKYKPGTVLVPGCGRGHDCHALARHGFRVMGLDISPRGVAEAKQLARKEVVSVKYRVGDFLRLSPSLRGRFDWIFEHTCFCAIDPALRDQYVRSALSALRKGGRLLGVFYNIQPKSGPPFGTTRAELIERFSPHMNLLLVKLPRSYPNRKGKELLMLWRKA